MNRIFVFKALRCCFICFIAEITGKSVQVGIPPLKEAHVLLQVSHVAVLYLEVFMRLSSIK